MRCRATGRRRSRACAAARCTCRIRPVVSDISLRDLPLLGLASEAAAGSGDRGVDVAPQPAQRARRPVEIAQRVEHRALDAPARKRVEGDAERRLVARGGIDQPEHADADEIGDLDLRRQPLREPLRQRLDERRRAPSRDGRAPRCRLDGGGASCRGVARADVMRAHCRSTSSRCARSPDISESCRRSACVASPATHAASARGVAASRSSGTRWPVPRYETEICRSRSNDTMRRERLGFVDLRQHDAVGRAHAKRSRIFRIEFERRVGRHHQMRARCRGATASTRSMSRGRVVGRRAAGGVDEQRRGAAVERGLQLVRRARDRKRRAEDVGVEAQLLDGADAEAVRGDQAEPVAVPRALLRGDLRDRRRLADARRADEHLDRREALVVGDERRQLLRERGAHAAERRAATPVGRVRLRDVARQSGVQAGRLEPCRDLLASAWSPCVASAVSRPPVGPPARPAGPPPR